MAKKTDVEQFSIKPPQSLIFRDEKLSADTEFVTHCHAFGQMIYVVSGVMEMEVEGLHYLAPPEFCIWIPQDTQHSSYNKKTVSFKIIDIAPQWTQDLFREPCIIGLSAIFSAIMHDFFARAVREPETQEDQRLVSVLIDQLKKSPSQTTFLPMTDDKLIAPILIHLQQEPADNTALAQWAARCYTSERTLSRRFNHVLGMTFGEWRQRLRFLHAVSLLEQGKSVQEVAFDVGYSSSSAFIAMFSQLAGTTPERFRHN